MKMGGFFQQTPSPHVCSCPHGVSMIMFEPGFCSDPQTDPPSAAPHLCHCMITFPPLENKHKVLIKK